MYRLILFAHDFAQRFVLNIIWQILDWSGPGRLVRSGKGSHGVLLKHNGEIATLGYWDAVESRVRPICDRQLRWRIFTILCGRGRIRSLGMIVDSEVLSQRRRSVPARVLQVKMQNLGLGCCNRREGAWLELGPPQDRCRANGVGAKVPDGLEVVI